MKKNNLFIKSTIYLIIGGMLTRLIGFVIKIIYTRMIGPEGVSLYSIVTPTYSMLITIVTFALPISLSKLISEAKTKSFKLLTNATFIIIFINIIIITIMYFCSEFIAVNLLNDIRCKNLLIAMSLTLPFISVSAIIKGYFNGKQRTFPYMLSNFLEQVLRLILILVFIPKLLSKGIIYTLTIFILLSIISELFSQLIFSFFLPKKTYLKTSDLKLNYDLSKDILNISLPIVSSKIIGNIGYFLEPIILTNLLKLSGYDMNYILLEYASYNAYAISILTIPAFFINALSQTLIPEISKYNALNNKIKVKKRVKQSILITIIIGIFFSIFILIFRDKLLLILYNTTLGSNYIKYLAPFFSIFYLESIMYSILQAINKAKIAFKISFIGVIIKLIFLTILSLCHIGLYSLVIAEIINIIMITILNIKELKKSNLL